MKDLKEIRKTTDYTRFHFLDTNRPICDKHAKELARKMEIDFLLPYEPIVVTNEGGIMDGQHRFEAARMQGLPVFYIEAEWGDKDPRTERTVIMLNTTTNTWRQEEFLYHYASSRGGIFKELQDFYEENKWLGISNAVVVFPYPKINAKQLKSGYAQFCRNPHLDRIMAFLGSEDVRGMAGKVNSQRYFVSAVRKFIETHTDVQVAKLKANIDRVTKQVSESIYSQMFENIVHRRQRAGKSSIL